MASHPGASIKGLSDDEEGLLQRMLGYDASSKEVARYSVAALINLGNNGGEQGQDVILYGYRADPPGSSISGAVPLPETLPLFLGGVFGMMLVRRRMRLRARIQPKCCTRSDGLRRAH